MATGWNFHELYLWHDTGNAATLFPPGLTIEPGDHAENAATKRRFRNIVEVSGLLEHLTPLPSLPLTEDDLALVHAPDYVARIKTLSAARGGDASHLTPFGPGSFEIARLAAGGTCALVDAVLSGQVANGYALVRPPGHHAVRDAGIGFCLFGNVPIAIRRARRRRTLGRVAVVDWDVHHGNGSELIFYDDPETLTISLHQDGLFPAGSGSRAERGVGAGEGFNINVPLPAGCGHGAYLCAFERVVLPALGRFKPDLIIVCSGFDGSAADPLGRMMLHSDSYRAMTALLMQAAEDLCEGRLALSHEGGYSASYVPYCGLAVMEQLSGIKTAVDDPFLPVYGAYPGHELLPHQEAAIALAAEAAGLGRGTTVAASSQGRRPEAEGAALDAVVSGGGFMTALRMPAEWEPHTRCWMAWPCRPESWRDGLGPARLAFAAVVAAIAAFEPVTLMVRPEDLDEARRLTGGAADLVPCDIDDSWTRDTGPTFVIDAGGGLAGIDWGFNAWGLAYEGFDRDARLAREILRRAGARRIAGPQILEGGSIHVDGEGTLLTTAQCLLDPKRNPHLDRLDIEANLMAALGVETVIWLPRGLTNDETLGHVDNLCCFFKPGHVLMPAIPAPADPDHAILTEARAVLDAALDARGRRLTIVDLPMPPRRIDARGRVMALSYVNFYLANGAVIMPGFDAATDAEAARVLASAFPNREVVIVPGHGIADGGGNIHCITQQQPRSSA